MIQAFFDVFTNGLPDIQADVLTAINAIILIVLIMLGTRYVVRLLMDRMNVDSEGKISWKESGDD